METYKIYIRFRERNISGYMQQFDDHYDVFFQDEEILQSMGGLISFDSNKKFLSAKQTTADDAQRFYKVVAEHLR
jgi:hypothetical protein